MKYTIFTDGGSRSNPGHAAIGFVIYDESGKKIFSGSKYIGKTTNNVAEYTALLFSIMKVKENNNISQLDFFLDSELVVKQIKGEYQIKKPELKELHDRIIDELKGIKYTITHVRRDKNKEADALVNQVLNSHLSN